ncbi:RNA chaperone ProQ [Arsukibacterium sp.]|uniref:RNA chaperone ProQ n=1 Tax=Arsukibacterium sp. TaxID=1977258 RepID=UPI002FDB6086
MTDATPMTDTLATETVATSNKPTNVKEVLALLAQQFPRCFSIQGEIQPLKVGIFQDLALRLADEGLISKTQLRQALRVYTSSWRYLEATKAGVARVDLDGVAGEVIDEQQAEHASKILAESKLKAAESRKTKLQQQRAQANPKPEPSVVKNKPNKKRPVRSNTQTAKPQPEAAPASNAVAPLTAVANEDLKVGASVLVKLGQSPMSATVLEAHGQDVTVQLGSGMVIKTRQDNLFQA